MAIRMTQEFPSTTDQYDQVNEKLDVENNWPDGLIVHSASDAGGGNMKVVDVWESVEKFNAFNEGKLMAAIGEVFGPDMQAPPEPPLIEELHFEGHKA
jgi:hypothetical protein